MVSVIIVSVFWFLLWPYARYQRVMCGCRVTMPTIPLTPGIMALFPTPSFRAKSFTEYAHHLSVHSSPFWECYLQNEFKTIAEEHPTSTSLLFVVEFCCLLHSANSILMIYPCSSFCCCWPSRYGHQKVGALCWISSRNGPLLYSNPCVGQKTGCVFEQGLSIGENCASREFSSRGSNKLEFSRTHTHTHCLERRQGKGG
jgi:hypothetical protein